MITHIVFFRLKDQSAANLAATKEKLLSMNGKVPQLRHLEVGVRAGGSEVAAGAAPRCGPSSWSRTRAAATTGAGGRVVTALDSTCREFPVVASCS